MGVRGGSPAAAMRPVGARLLADWWDPAVSALSWNKELGVYSDTRASHTPTRDQSERNEQTPVVTCHRSSSLHTSAFTKAKSNMEPLAAVEDLQSPADAQTRPTRCSIVAVFQQHSSND